MREIKFRAWNKSKGIMALVAHISNLLTVGGYVDVRMNEHDAVTKIEEEWSEGEYILMQFTGLLDKNGTEIYERDVVNHLTTSIPFDAFTAKEVVFEVGCFKVGSKDRQPTMLGWISPSCLEVIGNIHENPELLKEATQ